ncbi:MAG TPA: hypothetical protein VGA78_18470, partial [Gemmatimonadales bacterium]
MQTRKPPRPRKPFRLTRRPVTIRLGKRLRGGAARASLDPIEIASRDEIAALQLKRLRWTLRHVWDHVPHYRR